MKKSLIKKCCLLICMLVFTSCWNTEWTEQERIDFDKKCSERTTFYVGGICFTGYECDELDNAIVLEKKDQKIIDTLYINLNSRRDEHDKSYKRYWGGLDKEVLKVNHSYEFMFGDDEPYILHNMEMIMWAQYTMGGEGWGCEMGNFYIDDEKFEHTGNICFTKRGFEYE